MKRIAIFSSYCDGNNLHKNFINCYNLNESSRYNKDYKFVNNNESYTHAILLNTPMPKLTIPKENVIGLAFEPTPYLGLKSEFLSYARKHIGKYYIGSHSEILGDPFIERYGFLFYLNPIKELVPKNKLMSIMVSEKYDAPGHKYRHTLVKKILQTTLPIDILGRGVKYYKDDNRLIGEFKDDEPYYDYKFHICIENFQLPHYFSEKISTSLVHNTTPIYLGCKNIDIYFPDVVIKLSGDIDNDIQLLTDIISSPEKYMKNIDIKQIKNVLNIENII